MKKFSDNFKEYQYFLDAKSDKADLTLDIYKRSISKFLNFFKIDTIEKLSKLNAVQIRSYIMGLDLKATSKNSTIRNLKSFFSWLFDNDFISKNEMTKIKKLSEGTPVVKMPTIQEMDYVLENCTNEITHLILLLTSRVGLRRGELTEIKISDIDENGRIYINGKGNRKAYRTLPKDIFEKIKSYIASKNREESEYLFSYNGHKVSTTSINLRLTAYINSLPISDDRKLTLRRVHAYRHRCGTTVYQKTKDLQSVKHILRHTNINMGQRYIHVEDSDFKGLSESL